MGFADVLVMIAKGIEYVFSGISSAGSILTSERGNGPSASPMLTAFAASTGGVMTLIVVYMLVKGAKRVVSGLLCIIFAMIMLLGGSSLLLLAYAPTTLLLSDSFDSGNFSSSFNNTGNFSSYSIPCSKQ